MYVPKHSYLSAYVPNDVKSIVVVAQSEHFPGNLHIKLEVKTYPCGRIKLVARFAGAQITGDLTHTFKHITFDSVKSLYTVPGLRVLTDPVVVYRFCGLRPYACK